MHIWIIHQHAIPATLSGPTRHFELAKELINRGHSVTIFASNFCHNRFSVIAESYQKSGQVDLIDGVPFVWLDSPAYHGNSLARLWNMFQFATKLMRCDLSALHPPDVVIGSTPSPFAAFAAKKIAQRFKARFIYEIRDLWPETLINLGHFKRSHPFVILLSHIEKYLVRSSDSIISPLPGVAEYLQQKKMRHERILWLPNFINFEQISYKAVETSHPKLKIMYAGAFNISNDIQTLLEAVHLLEQQGWADRISIELMGEGPRKSELQKYVDEQQLSLVEFVPPVQKHDIFRMLQTADCFVGLVRDLPLYRWGTSLNKIADYLAVGRPVIFALNSPYDPISQAGAGLTVRPCDPEALAAAIQEMSLLSPARRNEMGENGRKYAQQYYNLRPLVDKLESHFCSS